MTDQASTLAHQARQPFPKLNTPVTNPDSTLGIPWYRLLITIWQRLGGSGVVTNTTAILQEAAPNATPVFVLDAMTGGLLGELQFAGAGGGAGQPQVVTASPFVYIATRSGTLVVESGQVAIARPPSLAFLICGLQGGAIPMLKGDSVQVTWYNSAPAVTFLPV